MTELTENDIIEKLDNIKRAINWSFYLLLIVISGIGLVVVTALD